MSGKKFKRFFKNIDAKVSSITVFVLLIFTALSVVFVMLPNNDFVASAAYTDFSNHKLITINHSYVDSTLTNFPVWVYNVSDDFKDTGNGGSIQPDGDDIAFFSFDNNTQYAHEIEVYDGSTGTIGVWVNVTSVSSSADTSFWVYYGDVDGSNQEDVSGTWNGNYVWVCHFMYGNATHIFDSLGHNNGTVAGSLNYNQSGAGGGYSIEFDTPGTTFANFTTAVAGSGTYDIFRTTATWEVIFKPNAYDASARSFMNADYGGSNTNDATLRMQTDLGMDFRLGGADTNPVDVPILAGGSFHTIWYYVSATWSDTDDNQSAYLNGTRTGSDTCDATYFGNENKGLSFPNSGDAAYSLDCFIDEARISSIRLSEDWMSATYETILNPDTFLTFGVEVGGGTSSVFTLNGLSSNNITWSGTADSSVWSNATGGAGGTLNITMVVNDTDNITEVRIYCDDLDVSINASNITLYVSSDNSSFGTLGSFSDGGSNISINETEWNDGTMGTNIFSGNGLTNDTFFIYARFVLAIPSGVDANTYSQSDWKVWFKAES